jgi:hypothetical protein
MTNKKLLTWFLIISGVLLVVLAFSAWMIYSFFAKAFSYLPEMPNEVREARVIVGAEFLARNQFLTTNQSFNLNPSTSLGAIVDISLREQDSEPGDDVVIAGRYGAMIVDRNGVKRSQIQYEFENEKTKVIIFETETPRRMLGDVQIIDIEGDGKCEYLARGSLDGAAVFNHQGKRLWSYGAFTDEKTSIDNVAAGDINGDGVSEFIAGWDAIEVFDKHGRRAWVQPLEGGLHQIEVVDIDGDRKNEIIHNHAGGMVIRDGQGKTIKEVEMPFYFSNFHLVTKPGETQPHMLAVHDESVWLVDFNGNVVKKFAAPLSKLINPRKPSTNELEDLFSGEVSVYKAKGVWVRLKEAQPEFLAVIAEFAAIDRSVLYIYSDEGKLVYHEVLPEQCFSIAVFSQADERRAQELLIGGSDTVWRYNAR